MSESISGFDPRSVAGCQLWLDASDTSSLTGSSPVTAWRNKGLSENNATYSGSPSISATAINGRQAMYFNGSSYFTGAISGANTTTITVFIVGSLISPFVGFSGLLCFGNASQLDYDNVGSLPITMYNADFKIYGARNSSSQPTPISANVPFLYVLQYDGTYINTWLNGTQQTDPSINIASSGTFTYTILSHVVRVQLQDNIFGRAILERYLYIKVHLLQLNVNRLRDIWDGNGVLKVPLYSLQVSQDWRCG